MSPLLLGNHVAGRVGLFEIAQSKSSRFAGQDHRDNWFTVIMSGFGS
jgi:hypothetical protein